MNRSNIETNGRQGNLEKGGHLDWQFITCFDRHKWSGTDILVITRSIVLKPSLFARLGPKNMVKGSLKIQADDSFPKIINWKIHFRYIGVYTIRGVFKK